MEQRPLLSNRNSEADGVAISRSGPGATDAELLAILAELAREVSSVLDLGDLLEKIPNLISRLTKFNVFSVYLLDEQRQELAIAYAVGYPEEIVKHFTIKVGQGTVGRAVAEQRTIVIDDVESDPHYLAVVPGAKSQLSVPLRNKGQVIGALNLLSEQKAAFTERDEWILRQFGAHVAQAIATARLFESEREYAETLETLAEIGREMSAILDPEELLTRLAQLIKRVIDYRIFGIALLDEDTQTLELKMTIKFGDAPHAVAPVRLGEGLVGYAALHKEVVLVPDVTKDPRYIDAVPGVRSELVVPLLLKDRCIGVFDLESPEPNAFNKKHVKLLTLLASEAAVALENARLVESIKANEARFEKELRFAQRVQMALLPQELPKRLRGVDVAWHFDPARELGGDLCDFLSPEANTLVVALGDVSGKGVPAALYSAAIGEMVRGRTFRRRLEKNPTTPALVLAGMNRILHERNLEEYYCTLCYAMFEFKKKIVTFANSGLPFPVKCTDGRAAQIDLPGIPLGSFGSSQYDNVEVPLAVGDVFVLCSDGIFEAFDEESQEFGAARVIDVVERTYTQPAKDIVAALFSAVQNFCGDAPQSDDRTVVVVKINQLGPKTDSQQSTVGS
ncbi:MAG TPA: GAF domain-containing SpoIIE family protein phosphatase [Vicinamibacterales bacterium]|nr:GAF domain-containing SpoIIE family protein phosphatase [Vicinamibacterales bacterium]